MVGIHQRSIGGGGTCGICCVIGCITSFIGGMMMDKHIADVLVALIICFTILLSGYIISESYIKIAEAEAKICWRMHGNG